MLITYKSLNAAVMTAAQNMKKNGECSLNATSLMDRLAKGFKLKSRQELKSQMSSVVGTATEVIEHTKESADEATHPYPEMEKHFVYYFTDSYRFLLTKNDKFKPYIEAYEGNAVYEYARDNDIAFFTEEDEGLAAECFSFDKRHEIVQYVTDNYQSSPLYLSDLSTQNYSTMNDMFAELISHRVKENLGMFHVNFTPAILEDFVANEMSWDDNFVLKLENHLKAMFSMVAL